MWDSCLQTLCIFTSIMYLYALVLSKAIKHKTPVAESVALLRQMSYLAFTVWTNLVAMDVLSTPC